MLTFALSEWKRVVASYPWILPVAELVAAVLGAWILRTVVLRQLRHLAAKTKAQVDDALVDLIDRAITPSLILGVVAIALGVLHLPPAFRHTTNRILLLATLAVVLYYASQAVQLLVNAWLSRRVPDESMRDPIRFATRVLFAALAIMIVLDNLGISLTAVWTTLGVGSVAVALALQDTLSNFFAGVYLRLDNPMRIGDYIKLESGEEGFVVQLGWRSARVRTLPNNIVVVPNAKLASTILTNYSLPEPQMSLLVSASVGYESDPDQVERVLVEEAAEAAETVEGLLKDPPPFVRFIPGFGESSLDFTLICRVSSFVDQYLAQHELRKRILARFRREGISIPFPQRD
ncbi:MAG: mechanosensitive ion channel family protein, partial [Chlamydiota bacterium]